MYVYIHNIQHIWLQCECVNVIITTYIDIPGMLPPHMPIVRDTITTPYSVNISWIVTNITFDPETYTVLDGSNMTMLLNASEVIEGNNDTSANNEVFSSNITGLIPFTTYYYIIRTINTVGSTNTSVMNFTTEETGTVHMHVYNN